VIDEILEAMEACGAAPSASLNVNENKEEINVLLYEVEDGYGEVFDNKRLLLQKKDKDKEVSCFTQNFRSFALEPFDKLNAKTLLDIKIQEAKEILNTLQTARNWLEK